MCIAAKTNTVTYAFFPVYCVYRQALQQTAQLAVLITVISNDNNNDITDNKGGVMASWLSQSEWQVVTVLPPCECR